MFAPTRYLQWAIRYHGRSELDMATSGTPSASLADFGPLPALEGPTRWGELRSRIAAHNGVPEAEVLPVLGTTQALWTAYTALLSPGDEALLERPAYEPMYRIAEGVGARVTWFDRPVEERFTLDPERVRRAITPRTRVVALTNLHNPGGVRTSDDVLREVAQIAAQHGAHLLVDEVYAEFDAMCDARGAWSGTARRLGPNVVCVSSLTKVYGLGPHRIGWVLAPPDVIARGEDALLASVGHLPLPWASLGCFAFEHLPAIADRARRLLAGKRERVEAWIGARPHLTWSAPREGLFGFATDTRGGDLTERLERAREGGLLVPPGAYFGIPSGARLSWALPAEKLEAALERLGQALE